MLSTHAGTAQHDASTSIFHTRRESLSIKASTKMVRNMSNVKTMALEWTVISSRYAFLLPGDALSTLTNTDGRKENGRGRALVRTSTANLELEYLVTFLLRMISKLRRPDCHLTA